MKSLLFILIALSFETAHAQFEGESGGDTTPVMSLKVERSDLRAITKKKQMKDDEGFVFAISKVLGKDQSNLDALNALAVHYIEKRKEGLAKIILNRALEAHPKSHVIHNNLAIVYLLEDEQRKAINSLKKAISLKPDYEIGLANLGSIYVEYGDYKRAVEPLREGYSAVSKQIAKRNEDAIKVASNYAVALAGTGEFNKARDVYKSVLDKDSRNVGVLYNFASLLIESLKEADEGRRVLSRLKFVADDTQLLAKAKKLEKLLESIEGEKSQ